MQLSIPAEPMNFRQWRSTRILLGALWLVALRGEAAASSSSPSGAVDPRSETNPRPPPSANSWSAHTGPWGTLKLRRIQLKPPVATLAQLSFATTRSWNFGPMPWPEIYAFLHEAHLTDAQWTELSDPDRRRIGIQSPDHAIETSPELLFSLSPESRVFIYNRLAKIPGNPDHALPYVLPDLAQIDQSDLNRALREGLKTLSYQRDSIRCLSDAHLLEGLVENADELLRLKRLLVSTPSLTVEVSRESLLQHDEVVRYWARNQGKSSRSLLRMLADSPDLDSLDIVHFLPPVPQAILNRFPDEHLPPSINCFWTALNFFNREPDHSYLPLPGEVDQAGKRALSTLQKNYERITPPYAFGDVLGLFAKRSDTSTLELLHTVSYIADDIVMTKNGAGTFTPFSLMTLDRVVALFAWPEGIEVRAFRLPPTSPLPAIHRAP